MKKIMTKLASLKARTFCSSILSLVVVAAAYFPDNCFFFFYEPKKPEGLGTIKAKDLYQRIIRIIATKITTKYVNTTLNRCGLNLTFSRLTSKLRINFVNGYNR